MSNIIDSGSTLRNMGLSDNKKTQASSNSKSAPESSTAPVSTDSDESVQLSATPEKITQIKETIDATPEVDSARVADIKAKIAAGEYPVNPEQIAEKMIDLEKLLS
ncbi:MAG: flagellar biosynthesis anti-sigma factor FlgM [Gammaproteobacteria bacterium]|nr:MAG: flagellar biosynthesis anti-sigma factor FlgM [Gammaproteobacteria bacterium]